MQFTSCFAAVNKARSGGLLAALNAHYWSTQPKYLVLGGLCCASLLRRPQTITRPKATLPSQCHKYSAFLCSHTHEICAVILAVYALVVSIAQGS